MPITIPTLDERKYQDLLDEALARIPVHNPEWTNFNKSDPGVTLVEVFAFLTENLLYRANQIPERNRRKFLSLLRVPFRAASAARGLVTFANERGSLEAVTINRGIEIRSGQMPFRTLMGLDVLPVEARVYYKREMTNLSPEQLAYYQQLYLSFLPTDPFDQAKLKLYETVRMPDPTPGGSGVDLSDPTVVDGLWIALLARRTEELSTVRSEIAEKTLSVGVVPYLSDATRELAALGGIASGTPMRLQFSIPTGGPLPTDRQPLYRTLPAEANADVIYEPGIVQVTLPEKAALQLWTNIDPLELGVGAFPPALEDTALSERLITWLHVTAPSSAQAHLYWIGINAAPIHQGTTITNEYLPDATGEPDQVVTLKHAPVLPGSVTLRITESNQETSIWKPVEDLLSAGPEVPVRDPRLPPGAVPPPPLSNAVFHLDAETGQLRFGDGLHGKRPPLGAKLSADYISSAGAAGNVGTGSVNASPALPAGLKVTNPVSTWGGADAESQAEAEKQIPHFLQHRDRLVSVKDFETITWRTPGVAIGRVEVLPAYQPGVSIDIGEASGKVTLLVIPRYDASQPEAPLPDKNFLNAICEYLEPRRLVTTELYLYGPSYVPIWVSIGIQVKPGASVAEVRERVKAAVRQFVSPLPAHADGSLVDENAQPGPYTSGVKGWPLKKSVVDVELAAVVGRVPDVLAVNKVRLMRLGTKDDETVIPMDGLLNLPRLAGLSVSIGDALTRQQLGVPDGSPTFDSGGSAGGPGPAQPNLTSPLPVPVIPEECK